MFKIFSLIIISAIFFCILKPTMQNERVLRLTSGQKMPILGLGTHGVNEEELEKILTTALELGYRNIDTAFIYQNEETIGKALKKWFKKGGKRGNIFITSKLPYFDNNPSSVEKYLKLSLEKLSLEYIDLYLIHAPFGVVRENESYNFVKNEDGTLKLDNETNHVAIWKEMEKQVKAGRIKSIGLSNFNETQILNILKEAEIKPSNLQVEVHLYHQQNSLLEFCRKYQIIVTGYAPLGSPGARESFHPEQIELDLPNPLKLPVIYKIAENHKTSYTGVLLRHLVHKGIAVIPSSKNPEHLKSNLQIFDFELTEEEIHQLNSLDKGNKGKIFDYKFLKGIEKHPQYPFDNAISRV